MGLGWGFGIERIGSSSMRNSHAVQVISRARSVEHQIVITTKTNHNDNVIKTTDDKPLVLYVTVKLNSLPVINARVTCDIHHYSHAGVITSVSRVELFDSGAGDPDIDKEDGIYSKYLTKVTKHGLYRLDIQVVSDQENKAFVYKNVIRKEKRKIGKCSTFKNPEPVYKSVPF